MSRIFVKHFIATRSKPCSKMSRATALLLILVVALVCISSVSCGPNGCGSNEVYKSCGSACQPKCGQKDAVLCPQVCVPGCMCIKGYVRNSQNQCVHVSKC